MKNILYIDTDMLVLCDIRELFLLNLSNCIVASNSGYIDCDVSNHKLQSLNNGADYDFSKLSYYFCAGLLLINYEAWIANDIESKCLDFLRHYKAQFPDQDALNAVINSNIVELPPEYGLLIYQCIDSLHDENMRHVIDNLKIAHFNGPSKPWRTTYAITQDLKLQKYPYSDEWWNMAMQTHGFLDEFVEMYNIQSQAITVNKVVLDSIADRMRQMDSRLAKLESKLNKPHKYIATKFKMWLQQQFSKH
ncbi:glycosyltransferase family 8 protein [Helicobacter muridarum]|uniref:glycosyltransferase family 8 protein n=1 Tax=Helicobacter muridarum TaxID=216 RepID=UPI0022789F6A|nr:glycosyltransferase [Helicobacter muridarum]